ncbi:MAG: hypothetical protein A2V66_05795 [Ignavibacteria bacterium RBG_13_36_8]|nr:MAG: hypothetical protein A2V66_05795 [Ignavibacteria bacterium RBG_13_36_8]
MFKTYDIHNYSPAPSELIHFIVDDIKDSLHLDNRHIDKSHSHNFFSIMFIKKGKGRQIIDFESYNIKPNTIFFIAPGQVHRWVNPKFIKGSVLKFTEHFYTLHAKRESVLKDFTFMYGIKNRSCLFASEELFKKLYSTVRIILKEYNSSIDYKNEMLGVYLLQLLINLKRAIKSEGPCDNIDFNSTIAHQFKILLEEKYKESKSVSDYAKLLNLNVRRLTSITKRKYSKNVGVLIRERVILEAKRMLVHTGKSIAEISYDLGLEDPSYFTRIFKKHMKISPQQFRTNYR